MVPSMRWAMFCSKVPMHVRDGTTVLRGQRPAWWKPWYMTRRLLILAIFHFACVGTGVPAPFAQRGFVLHGGSRSGPDPLDSAVLCGLRSVQSTAKVGSLAAQGRPTAAELPPRFVWTRLRVFLGLLLGYTVFYVNRSSLNYVGPTLVDELGLELSQVGLLQTAGQISVGVNKLLFGVLAADISPSGLLAGGLLLTGMTNLAAGSLPATGPALATLSLACLWLANGIWQGLGSPACARVVNAWFRPGERGTYWAIWNTSNNLGGALSPLAVAFGVAFGGWRWGFRVPGLLAAATASVLFAVLRDSPERAGLPPLYSGAEAPRATAGAESGGAAKTERGWELFLNGVLRQPGLAKLCVANVLLYVVRAGLQAWGAFFLLRQGSSLQLGEALQLLGLFEVGGLVGSVAGGAISDAYIARCSPDRPLVGSRVEVAVFFILGLAASLGMLVSLPAAQAGSFASACALFAAGFFLYGPQALLALCGMELVSRRAVGASQGVLGLAAYFGAALSGLPFGWLLQRPYGWQAWRTAMLSCTLGVVLAVLPLRRVSSREQRDAKEEAPL
mmetsp:Transcript_96922/g.269639  ORF Transcript_96922/g.269639 Transcript_96922/m.269639 type:complete len:560 (-) Transcript_96922:119-1798(-)